MGPEFPSDALAPQRETGDKAAIKRVQAEVRAENQERLRKRKL